MNRNFKVTYFEARMVEIESLKLEKEITKARFEIGQITREGYVSDLIRIDSRLCDLVVEARDMSLERRED